ncbi:MAG: GNAT family N-acetyltransferase [Shimia sp.]
MIAALAEAVRVTWPAEETLTVGPFTIRRASDDSRRTRCATTEGDASDAEIAAASDAMRALGQPVLFYADDRHGALDARLAARGLVAADAAAYYAAPVARLSRTPPAMTAFEVWPPLAIMAELFAATGTPRPRQAVMARAACPRTAILGRADDRPGGVAYVGAHDGIAVVHALGVVPALRRRGLAGHMMAQAALWAGRQGCSTLGLAVGARNDGAQALYRALGMERVGGYHYRTEEETP